MVIDACWLSGSDTRIAFTVRATASNGSACSGAVISVWRKTAFGWRTAERRRLGGEGRRALTFEADDHVVHRRLVAEVALDLVDELAGQHRLLDDPHLAAHAQQKAAHRAVLLLAFGEDGARVR